MKHLSTFLLIISGALFLGSCAPSAVVVRERPVAPIVTRPAPPFVGAVWIDGEWEMRRGHYVYVQPHYVRPHNGSAWVPGYWRATRHGDVWVKGHWR